MTGNRSHGKAGGEARALKAGLKAKAGPVRQDTKQRIARWRAMAAAIANKNPNASDIQIARTIQRSSAGKRKGGVLPYSISAILKYIRSS